MNLFKKITIYSSIFALINSSNLPTKEEQKNNYDQILMNIKKNFKGRIPNQIKHIVAYLANHDAFLKENIKPVDCLLLHGENGTGKTHLVETMAKSLNINFFNYPASCFLDEEFISGSEKLNLTFAKAKSTNKPVLFFIDHIDCITAVNSNSEINYKLINALSYQLEKIKNDPNIFLILATDDKDAIDKKILNKLSGSIIEIKKLNQDDKAELLEKLFQDYNLKNYEGYPNALAPVLKSDNFSNRDLKHIVQRARFYQHIECIKDNKCEEPLHKYFREAIEGAEKDPNYSENPKFGSGI